MINIHHTKNVTRCRFLHIQFVSTFVLFKIRNQFKKIKQKTFKKKSSTIQHRFQSDNL